MKRCLYSIVYLVFASVFFISCANINENRTDGQYIDNENLSGQDNLTVTQGDEFLFELESGALSSAGATFTLTNLSGSDISFGEPYNLQVWRGDAWDGLEIDCDWTGVLYEVPPDGKCSFTAKWKSLFGELPEGRYRLVKEITSDGREGNAVCEFSINGE